MTAILVAWTAINTVGLGAAFLYIFSLRNKVNNVFAQVSQDVKKLDRRTR